MSIQTAPKSATTIDRKRGGTNRCASCGDFITPAKGCPRCQKTRDLRLKLLQTEGALTQVREHEAHLRRTLANTHGAYHRTVLVALALFAAAVTGWALYLFEGTR